MKSTTIRISGKQLAAIASFFFAAVSNAQIVKVETDSVIVYCKYNDFVHEMDQHKYWGSTTYWEPRKCLFVKYKKKITERDPPGYVDSVKALKRTGTDTIVVSENLWYNEAYYETEALLRKHKLSFFDKRSNRMAVHIKKSVKGKRGEILFNVYTDRETKNELYITVKRSWQEL